MTKTSSTPLLLLLATSLFIGCGSQTDVLTEPGPSAYPGTIPDTEQSYCFDELTAIDCQAEGAGFFGQDAQYLGETLAYQDHGDGTVTDEITGLMWTQTFTQTSWDQAFVVAAELTTGGYDDWRVPTIKELYSLMSFAGNTGTGTQDELAVPDDAVPFVDTDTFDFEYGQVNRFIDAQYVSSTQYVGTTMGGDETFFGLNFADGRIKGYPIQRPGGLSYYAYFVRGGGDYGQNAFADNGDETITDAGTGLMWMQHDNGHYGHGDATYGGFIWADALAYCEALDLADQDDWRLPNAKELQSLVDYTRSPTTTDSPAIDPLFGTTAITVEDGSQNYPFYWSATTHVEGSASRAAYVAFGQAFGFMTDPNGGTTFMDVHGAGCQRSDPKVGDPADYPTGFGPQGDVIRIYNFIRCVRGGAEITTQTSPASTWQGGTGDPPGPATCTIDDDCLAEGTCPPDATMGCTCEDIGGESICVPACSIDADCPTGMNGEEMACQGGMCVPAG